MDECGWSRPVDFILQAHGSGGKLSQELLQNLFLPILDNEFLREQADGAMGLELSPPFAMASDSFVVRPLFFAGGDIGKLAVTGVANDLAMCGARAKYLSLNWILEEGCALEILRKIVESVADAAKKQNILVVTGDTKVVEKGKGDQLFLSASGIGESLPDWQLSTRHIQAGDDILISGDIARHGLAVMAARENLGLQIPFISDCQPLFPLVEKLWQEKVFPKCMRDLTRGGLAATLWEWAKSSGLCLLLQEREVPLQEGVKACCEILGLDPIHIANEGTMALVIAPEQTAAALAILQEFSPWARKIGQVQKGPARVLGERLFGSPRLIDLPRTDPMPRIC